MRNWKVVTNMSVNTLW